jgi:hypothetical protein
MITVQRLNYQSLRQHEAKWTCLKVKTSKCPKKGNLNVDLGSVLVLKYMAELLAGLKDIEGPRQKG